MRDLSIPLELSALHLFEKIRSHKSDESLQPERGDHLQISFLKGGRP